MTSRIKLTLFLAAICCCLCKASTCSEKTCTNSEEDYVQSLFVKLASLHTCSAQQFPVKAFNTVPVDSMTILSAIASELLSLDVQDVHYTTGAALIGTVPATPGFEDVAPLAFVAHVDQSCAYLISQVAIYSNGRQGIPDGPTPVKPWVHPNWDGEPFSFPDDPELIMSKDAVPRLASAMNKTLITGSGKSPLGADGLAGAVSIIALARRLLSPPQSNNNNKKIPIVEKNHGPIRLVFMPASELNCAVHLLSPGDIKAEMAYMLDAETPGDIRYESPIIEYLSFKMQSYGLQPALGSGTSLDYPAVYNVSLSHMPFVAASVLKIMAESRFSCDTSKGREAYFEITKLELLGFGITLEVKIRAFDELSLEEIVNFVRHAVRTVGAQHPRTITIEEVARTRLASNNWDLLGQDAGPVRLARAAMRATGQKNPVSTPTRELTDSWGLSTLGLPSILLFSAWHAAHGPLEWTTVEEMVQVTDTIQVLSGLWLTEHVQNEWCPAGSEYDANSESRSVLDYTIYGPAP